MMKCEYPGNVNHLKSKMTKKKNIFVQLYFRPSSHFEVYPFLHAPLRLKCHFVILKVIFVHYPKLLGRSFIGGGG